MQSNTNVLLIKLEVLPVLSKSITNEGSVHQFCINLENVRLQVKQSTMLIHTNKQVFDKMTDLVSSGHDRINIYYQCLNIANFLKH